MLMRMAGLWASLALTLGLALGASVAAGETPAFAVEAATQAYLQATPPEEIANTTAYVNTGYLIMVLDTIAAVLLAWLLLARGWSRRWRELAERKLRSPFAQAFVYVPIYALVSAALLFPLGWFSEYFTEHRFGLSNQSFGAWFFEYLLSGIVTALLLALFVGLLYVVIRRSGERWWAWGAGVSIAFMMFMLLIAPVYVAPLFNEYRPMDEGPLKERILSIARANGMQADDIKQVDQSRQHKRVSANVSGLFGTARIALNDNLLNRADAEAVEAVMAHEIGHFVLNHVGKMLLAMFPLLLGLFFLTDLIFRAFQRRWGERWGVRGPGDYAGFPLLVAIISVLTFLATPLFYRISYTQEYEADLFAINATQNPEAWADVALLTAEYRKLQPSAREERWLNHHPSPYARIYMAMRWKAEHLPATGAAAARAKASVAGAAQPQVNVKPAVE